MKKIIRIYVRFVQRILITILLSVLYITVFSFTKLFYIIFPSKHTQHKKSGDTYWLPAEGYTSDMKTAMEQS